MNVSGFRVAVDWSDSFILNGPLDSYELSENGLLIYEGKQNKKDLGARIEGDYTYIVQAFTSFQGRRHDATSLPSDKVSVPGKGISQLVTFFKDTLFTLKRQGLFPTSDICNTIDIVEIFLVFRISK